MVASYPFSAVVGLEDLKLALILNAVSPRVGGVLVRGEKGTAKSTIVRALAGLLPRVAIVQDCRFSCDPAALDPSCPDGPHDSRADTTYDSGPGSDGDRPNESREPVGALRPARLVELPVGASEDRLAGSLDIERALTEGVKAFEPGLLAQAHRGVLYVDEVNLLHDHLVDLLLDAAALGTCYVEREGVSVRHAARFLLVGTMNPEEGELRPQLLDRFGLTVEVRASRDPGERAEVIRRRLAYDADPGGFAIRWATDEAALGRRIAQARERVAEVELPDSALKQIATVCAAFEVDGMRADLVTAHTAIAHAAWRGRTAVTAEDVREAARLSLPHRRRRDPFDAPGLDESRLDEILGEPWDPDDDPGGGRGEEADGQAPVDQSSEPSAGRSDRTPHRPPSPADATGHESSHETGRPDRGEAPGATGQDAGGRDEEGRQPGGRDAGGDHADPGAGKLTGGPDPAEGHASPPDTPYRTRLLTVPGVGAGAPGRRSRARTPHGRTSGARLPEGRVGTLHLLATLRAAAPYQGERGRTGPGLRIERSDLREAVREGREGNLVLFLVDASGSMAARQRMRAVKGAMLSLLLDAYQRRDKVGLVTFRGDRADLVLPPTSSVEAGAARLKDLRTGGRTPLAAGLLKAADVLRVERLRDPSRRPLLVVVTDGRATGSPAMADVFRAAEPLAGVASVVVDCESGPVRLGLAGELAFRLGARAVRLEDLAADGLTEVVRHVRKAA